MEAPPYRVECKGKPRHFIPQNRHELPLIPAYKLSLQPRGVLAVDVWHTTTQTRVESHDKRRESILGPDWLVILIPPPTYRNCF